MTSNLLQMGSQSRRVPTALVATCVILAAGLLLSLRLIVRGFVVGHDTQTQIRWIIEFDNGLSSGSLYPRWLSNVNEGYGNPTFVFYGPLAYYLTSAIRLITDDVETRLIIGSIVALVASGLGMYLYARLFFAYLPSIMAALTYMALPYHMVDLYRRVAFSELWAFAWLPLILRFIARIPDGNPLNFLGLSLAYASLILMHLPTAVLFAPMMVAYAVVQAWKGMKNLVLVRFVGACGLALGLSSVYLVPAIFEQRFVQIRHLTEWPGQKFMENFLFSDIDISGYWMRYITEIAVVQFLLFAAVSISYGLLIASKADCDLVRDERKEWGLFVAAGICSYFLMLKPSGAVWGLFTPVLKVVFPWRMLVMVCLAIAFLMGGWIARLRGGFERSFVGLGLVVVTLITLGLNVGVTAFKVIKGSWHDRPTMSRMLATSNVSMDEIAFRPKGAPLGKLVPGEEFRASPTAWFVRGGGDVQVLDWRPEERQMRVNAEMGGLLRVRTFYYPGWTAYIDGARTAARVNPSGGEIEIDVTAGVHLIELRFLDTWERKLGKVLSGMSGIGLVVVFGVWVRRNGRWARTVAGAR